MKRRYLGVIGLSLTEIIVSLFLLSFVALAILSLFQSGFAAQNRTQKANLANFITQGVIADLRIWAQDYDNFNSTWGPYNRTFTDPDNPDYEVTVRSVPGARPIYSPSAELESQWEVHTRGARIMPTAIVPVEITVSWSASSKDRIETTLYVGEPWRDPTGAAATLTGPSPTSLNVGGTATGSVTLNDSGGRPFENLLFQWKVDTRYLEHTVNSQRDGRSYEIERIDPPPSPPNPPTIDPPIPPEQSPLQCYGLYGGEFMPIVGGGIELP